MTTRTLIDALIVVLIVTLALLMYRCMAVESEDDHVVSPEFKKIMKYHGAQVLYE